MTPPDMAEGFVVVGAFDYQPNAAAAKALLESRGIEVVRSDVETTSANWFWAGWTGGIKLAVPRSRAVDAEKLLKDLRSTRPAVEGHVDRGACLACGAVMTEEQSTCTACGWSFQDEGSK